MHSPFCSPSRPTPPPALSAPSGTLPAAPARLAPRCAPMLRPCLNHVSVCMSSAVAIADSPDTHRFAGFRLRGSDPAPVPEKTRKQKKQ